MLKKRWIAVWMSLIMLFSCFPVQVFAAGASITSERAVDITKTNATFKAVLNNPTGIQPAEVGIYFGETQGSMRPAAKDTYVYNQTSLDFWYNANADMGITLKPATTYWYRFYAIINGQTVWGSFKSMQTAGQAVQQARPQAKPQASFGNERVNDKTETNGTFYGVLYNPTGIQPSEVGCYIGKSADNMKLLGKDTYVYNRSSLEVWYNANAEGVRLEPGTKYYYQFYAIIGGQKVMGDRKSVTMKGTTAVVHTHDWKTVVEKAHPHKSVRSCSCGVSEVVKSSNYASSCATCNPPKAEAVKKATFANGTYEISNNASGKFLNAYGSGSGWKVVTIAGDSSAEQRFTLNGGNGNYTIQTQGYGGRGLYLSGTTLLTGQTGQFCFVNRGSGYTISPANDPSKVLTQTNTAMYGGDHVVTLQNYTGAANQLWTLSHKTTTQQAAVSFEQRTYAPTYGQGCFGAPYNKFPFNNGNCTWYVYGRAYEILGKAPVFNGNATDFWNYRDSYYGHSTNPTAAKPGAVMVWGGGDGGYGHVAIVEAVNGNTITISESSYGGVWYTGSYWGRTNLNVNSLNIYGLTFKGYIYLMPGSAVTQTPATQTAVVQKPVVQAPETVVEHKTGYYKTGRHNVPVYGANDPKEILSYLYKDEIVYITKIINVNGQKRGELKKWDYKNSDINYDPFYGGYVNMQELIKVNAPATGISYADRIDGITNMLKSRNLDKELFCEYNYAIDYVEKKYAGKLNKVEDYQWQSTYLTVLNDILDGETYDAGGKTYRDNSTWDDAIEIAGILDWTGIVNAIAVYSKEESKKFVVDMQDFMVLVELYQNTEDNNLRKAARCVIFDRYKELEKTAIKYGFQEKLLNYVEKALGTHPVGAIVGVVNKVNDVVDISGVIFGGNTNQRLAVEIMACDEIRNTMSVVFHKNIQASGEKADLRAIQNWETAKNAMTEAYNRIQPIIGYVKFWEEYYKEGELYKGMDVSDARLRTYFTKQLSGRF